MLVKKIGYRTTTQRIWGFHPFDENPKASSDRALIRSAEGLQLCSLCHDNLKQSEHAAAKHQCRKKPAALNSRLRVRRRRKPCSVHDRLQGRANLRKLGLKRCERQYTDRTAHSRIDSAIKYSLPVFGLVKNLHSNRLLGARNLGGQR